MITVKIAQVPGPLNTYVLEGGITVGEALDQASMSSEGFSIKVNGVAATTDTVLTEDATILLVEKTKGG